MMMMMMADKERERKWIQIASTLEKIMELKLELKRKGMKRRFLLILFWEEKKWNKKPVKSCALRIKCDSILCMLFESKWTLSTACDASNRFICLYCVFFPSLVLLCTFSSFVIVFWNLLNWFRKVFLRYSWCDDDNDLLHCAF